MAKSATVKWTLPTVRTDGEALDPADIGGVEVSLAIAGAPSTVLNVVPPPTLELLVPDLESGDWVFTLVCIDTDGLRGPPVDELFTIPQEPPGVVTGVGVTLS
jgi:hypothetical protein